MNEYKLTIKVSLKSEWQRNKWTNLLTLYANVPQVAQCVVMFVTLHIHTWNGRHTIITPYLYGASWLEWTGSTNSSLSPSSSVLFIFFLSNQRMLLLSSAALVAGLYESLDVITCLKNTLSTLQVRKDAEQVCSCTGNQCPLVRPETDGMWKTPDTRVMQDAWSLTMHTTGTVTYLFFKCFTVHLIALVINLLKIWDAWSAFYSSQYVTSHRMQLSVQCVGLFQLTQSVRQLQYPYPTCVIRRCKWNETKTLLTHEKKNITLQACQCLNDHLTRVSGVTHLFILTRRLTIVSLLATRLIWLTIDSDSFPFSLDNGSGDQFHSLLSSVCSVVHVVNCTLIKILWARAMYLSVPHGQRTHSNTRLSLSLSLSLHIACHFNFN